MDKFVRLEGVVAPLDRSNVDTDAIIPKQFLKSPVQVPTSHADNVGQSTTYV